MFIGEIDKKFLIDYKTFMFQEHIDTNEIKYLTCKNKISRFTEISINIKFPYYSTSIPPSKTYKNFLDNLQLRGAEKILNRMVQDFFIEDFRFQIKRFSK